MSIGWVRHDLPKIDAATRPRKALKMFHRIVVPLDGSELAEQALDLATELGRATNASIRLVRVVDLGRLDMGGSLVIGMSTWGLQRALDNEQGRAKDYLERLRRSLTKRGVDATAEVRHGHTPEEIVAATDEGDLIVMSTHGRGGVPRWFLGSVAEEVARHAAGPVMLVRAIPAKQEGEALYAQVAPLLVDAGLMP